MNTHKSVRSLHTQNLVNEVFEDARVGVLRGEGEAQHFQPHARHLFNDRGVVAVPPAAFLGSREGQQK